MTEQLAVYAMFRSLQGESTFAGMPCVFIRLAGCTADCHYCDTVEAAHAAGQMRSIDDIVDAVACYNTPVVEVTGGEPLEQAATPQLLTRLCDAGYTVLLETNGIEDISLVDRRVHIIMDVKTPGSGAGPVPVTNIDEIKKRRGQVKFVLTGIDDFKFACDQAGDHGLFECCEVLVSAVESVPKPEVARWILDSGMPFRYQLQLHKVLWPGQNDV